MLWALVLARWVPAAESEQQNAAAAVLLARNCLECHNPSDKKGGLDLTRRDTALAGGDSGTVLLPNEPDKSPLLARLEASEMPPEGRRKLSDDERKLVREWIAAGAKWATDPIDPFLVTTDRRAGYNWWSLQPIVRPQAPEIRNPQSAIRNSIDHFILAKLTEHGLSLSPEADRRTLIRRLYFDLTGLPPPPDEVEAFVADGDPRAYERLVDRLLDSPHYGERWARHWLDIVRFGESQGFERNKFRESAWKYRDFVVEAFNSDLPYDDFIRWQIAGDVLRPDDPLAVVASGFLVVGPYDLTAYSTGTEDMRKFAREEELEGLVATVCQSFLGLTVNCSRCHDHKFDPVSQKEFYQLSAALGGTNQGDERDCLPGDKRAAADERIAKLRTEIESLSGKPELADQRSRLESVVRLLEAGKVHSTTPKQPDAWRILARGDYRQPGEVVSPRGIAAVTGVSPDWGLAQDAPEAERRKSLASWIADANNPLTPRVIVNRLWAWHFGEGIVRTTSDLGFQGGQPSHPELLDWLADELVHSSTPTRSVSEGTPVRPWSLKHIQRLILNSATYRQSANSERGARSAEPQAPSSALRAPSSIDADNRYLWHMNRRRLEAETYRDAVLAVSGDLERRIGGPGYRDFKVTTAGSNDNYFVFDAVGPEFNRRSLYRTSVRSGTSPLLDTLDCPDPSVATPRRSVTTTPLQALTLLNNVFSEHYAGRFAERLKREAPDDVAAQIQRAYSLAFGRRANDEEVDFAKSFIAERDLEQFCIVLFNSSEFMYVD